MLDDSWDFDRFADPIRALPEEIGPANLLSDDFRLYSDQDLSIYYAPFDYVNERARIALVGITPGLREMEIAFRAARQGLSAGYDRKTVLTDVKRAASFAGSMRANLIAMLDSLGVPDLLGITSTKALFEDQAGFLHSTSAIRHPVFRDGRNYNGHRPRPLKHPVLTAFVEERLAPELAEVDRALIVPLGKAVETCLDSLVNAGRLDRARCLFGFPHASGANGHRVRQFSERRDDLETKVRAWFAN